MKIQQEKTIGFLLLGWGFRLRSALLLRRWHLLRSSFLWWWYILRRDRFGGCGRWQYRAAIAMFQLDNAGWIAVSKLACSFDGASDLAFALIGDG